MEAIPNNYIIWKTDNMLTLTPRNTPVSRVLIFLHGFGDKVEEWATFFSNPKTTPHVTILLM